VHWLKDDIDLVATRVREYQSLRDMVVRTFNSTNFIRAVPSQGTSYIFPRIIGIDASDQKVALQLQRKAGVIVNPGYQSGKLGTGHIRICFAQDEKIMSNALDRIVESIATLRN
jgi:aspartate/methionine/tyrosine aminotransferase